MFVQSNLGSRKGYSAMRNIIKRRVEQEMTLIGFGDRKKTLGFIAICNDFVCLLLE